MMMEDEASSLIGSRDSQSPTRSASTTFFRSFKKLFQIVLVICSISVILLIINSRKEVNWQGARSHSSIKSEMVRVGSTKQHLVHPTSSHNERATNLGHCEKQHEPSIASIYSLGQDGGDIETEIGASHVHTAYEYSIDAVSSDSGFFTPSETCQKQCCSRPYLLNSHVEQSTVLTVFSPRELAEVRFGNLPVPESERFLSPQLTKQMLPCLREGVIIQVDGNAIKRFFDVMHDAIPVSYVLVSGDSDSSSPGTEFVEKLNDKKILHWFGHNPSIDARSNGKYTSMPIGLSQWTAQQPLIERVLNARNFRNPFEDTHARSCFDVMAPSHQQKPQVMMSFSQGSHHVRPSVWSSLCSNETSRSPLVRCDFSRKRPLAHLYDILDEMKFGVSPKGVGVDCYRTWEYLYLGIIPIVERSTEMESLYTDLPVLQLSSWDKMKPATLRKLLRDYVNSQEFRSAAFDGWHRLFLKYWRTQVLIAAKRVPAQRKDPSTGQTYHELFRYY